MEETEYDRLLAASIRFVSYRPRSEKEIRDFCAKTLKRHHTTAPLVVSRVIERLKEYGYVDDVKFVEWWVTQRTTFKPKGIRVIISELRSKGIPREVAEEYFSKASDMPGQDELARTAAKKKLSIWRTLPSQKRKQKLAEFLVRRGFDAETVWSVVDDILEKE